MTEEKIECKICGEPILESTAIKNRGRCFPCKQRRRFYCFKCKKPVTFTSSIDEKECPHCSFLIRNPHHRSKTFRSDGSSCELCGNTENVRVYDYVLAKYIERKDISSETFQRIYEFAGVGSRAYCDGCVKRDMFMKVLLRCIPGLIPLFVLFLVVREPFFLFIVIAAVAVPFYLLQRRYGREYGNTLAARKAMDQNLTHPYLKTYGDLCIFSQRMWKQMQKDYQQGE